MRYIELQRALQSRLNELEKLCERERSILMGRWKTHSLPARKRTPTNADSNISEDTSAATNLNSSTVHCCRPASSTEHLLLYSVVIVKTNSFLRIYTSKYLQKSLIIFCYSTLMADLILFPAILLVL